MIKDLNINGIVYAKYEIENNILYFEVLKNLNTLTINYTEAENKNFIINSILFIEDNNVIKEIKQMQREQQKIIEQPKYNQL